MNLREELKELLVGKNPHRRGKDFEAFIVHMLEEEGFEVTYDAKVASPRQTDLFARKGNLYFIVEAKWTRKKLHIGDTSSVRDRLTRVPPDVFACIFSMSGYSQESIEDVRAQRNREIILFNRNEIGSIADGRLSFSDLLSDKRQTLRADAVVLLREDKIPEPPRLHLRVAPDVFQVGARHVDWMKSGTQHIDIAFSNELLDCAGGKGGPLFSLELNLPISKPESLRRVIGVLNRYLHLSGQGSFAIHQGEVGWFGFGFESFLAAVRDQKGRYRELNWQTYHHSEELAYLDRLDCGGLMCLSSRQAVGREYFHMSRVEVYFPGLPLLTADIQELCERTNNLEAQVEIVRRNPVQAVRFYPAIKVQPIALIISDTGDSRYASGIVARNPFFNKSIPPEKGRTVVDLQRTIPGCEFLFCALKNWHGHTVQMDEYELRSIEGCWIEHYYALHVVCDWV